MPSTQQDDEDDDKDADSKRDTAQVQMKVKTLKSWVNKRVVDLTMIVNLNPAVHLQVWKLESEWDWKYESNESKHLTCVDRAGAEEVGAASAGVGDAKLGADYPIGAEEEQTSTKCHKDDPPEHNWGEVTQTNDQEVQVTLTTIGEE